MPEVRKVEFRRRKLNAVFQRAEQLKEQPELQADYARHLCVLISGFVERSIAEIIVEYASNKTASPLRSFVEVTLKRLQNVDVDRLLNTIGSLDANWRLQLEEYVGDERKAALNSIVGLRNDIAHGGGQSVSLVQVMKYWVAVQEITDKVTEILLPEPRIITSSIKKEKNKVSS